MYGVIRYYTIQTQVGDGGVGWVCVDRSRSSKATTIVCTPRFASRIPLDR